MAGRSLLSKVALVSEARVAAVVLARHGERAAAIRLLIGLDQALRDPHPRFRRFIAAQVRIVEDALGLPHEADLATPEAAHAL
ncbi:hypothetical protein [Hansschlegelia zhihuaiae]|uniref:Uncharacterized protein n=1 Tax=Hansschlegelia zhihuaiae TaxID=405005 RepID=A0A4Q0MF40_9HYPH|nr:hypothetical protein [Hansschlegelia zhihuaiae]RXF72087.1 hypothetical protein EK403_14860 [Hansschlegelia zhihuaiae]